MRFSRHPVRPWPRDSLGEILVNSVRWFKKSTEELRNCPRLATFYCNLLYCRPVEWASRLRRGQGSGIYVLPQLENRASAGWRRLPTQSPAMTAIPYEVSV